MLSLLEEALSDDDSKIWKEALDGLVTLASPESLEVLRRAMMRRFATERETLEFREWLDEAIQQAGDHIKSQITHVRE